VSRERHARLLPVQEDARVTPIELFFDLVFVFSLTQVTALMAHSESVHGLIQGLLILSLLWWCWVAFAWLGNLVQAEEGLGRVAIFGSMAAMFVMALAVPEAFRDFEGGVQGPVVVAFAYLAIRMTHLAIFWMTARTEHDRALRTQLLKFAPVVVGSTALLLVASQLEGTPQTLMWVAVVIVDYVGTILGGASGWRLRSASHFAERHGLIVIVALGESIVAIGVGVAGLAISWPIIVGSVLGLTVASCIWWAYFDIVSIVAERVLKRLRGEERARLARDAYSYLHLPMVMGIVLVATGVEQVLEQVGAPGHNVSESLRLLAIVALYGGAALFLFGQVAFKRRTWGQITLRRLLVAALICALIPVAAEIPALLALALLAAVLVVLIASEVVRYAEIREQIRHEDAGPEVHGAATDPGTAFGPDGT
jgi:low temperature requirement protein LtrA